MHELLRKKSREHGHSLMNLQTEFGYVEEINIRVFIFETSASTGGVDIDLHVVGLDSTTLMDLELK